jgi:DNA-binding SARP family transcriptional activator
MHAGRTVPVTALLDTVWPQQPPPSVRGTLQSYVSRLRAVLGAERLTRSDGGYRLTLGPAELDAWVLRDAVQAVAAHPEDAAATAALVRAVELWRGRPLGALGAEPAFAAFVAQLETLHCRALAALAQQQMDAGDADTAAMLLQVGIADHPHDSELVRLLVLGYVRQGRLDAAISAYRAFADRLRRDLGVAPDGQLQRIVAEVVNGRSGARASQRPVERRVQATVVDASPLAGGLVGRRDDLDRLGRLLGKHRWTTLIGPPGVGTSRLALEVARREERTYPGGALRIRADSINGSGDLLAGLLEAYRVDAQPGVSRVRSLVRAMRRNAPTLLLLDNVARLDRTSRDVLADLMGRVDHLTLVVTSHGPLDAPDEHVVPIDPLPTPDERSRLLESASGQLMWDRANRYQPGMAVSPENEAAMVRVVRRLDGLPLAIELAAAQLAVLGPAELERRLDDRFAVLVAPGPFGRPVSLHASIAAAMAEVDDFSRAVLEQLSVAGDCLPMAAAERLVADRCPSHTTPRAAILAVARRSLVTVDRDRVSMLQSIRDFCAAALPAFA